MKISQREKNLLIAVSCVLVAVLYYQFIFAPKQDEIQNLEQELSDVQLRYDQVMENIATLDKRKEKIILALDELINESNIQATIGFSQVSAQAVEPFTGGTYELPQSSLSGLANDYHDLTNEGSLVEEDASHAQSNLVTSTSTAEVMSISLTFTGAYENVKSFIDAVQEWNYNLIITNLSLTPLNDTDVSGSLTLEFYAIPKLEGQDQDYLTWTLENTYGKEMPFSNGAASGAYSSTMEQLLAAGVKAYDFMMLVRSSTSDLPAVTIGKALDETRESYLFTDKNEVETVKITLTQQDDKYYYQFETSQGKYPQGEEAAMEFTPINDSIEFQVMSESRPDVTDAVGVNLNIINNTDLVVNVEVKDDDQTNPRVKVVSEGFTINVTKK